MTVTWQSLLHGPLVKELLHKDVLGNTQLPDYGGWGLCAAILNHRRLITKGGYLHNPLGLDSASHDCSRVMLRGMRNFQSMVGGGLRAMRCYPESMMSCHYNSQYLT